MIKAIVFDLFGVLISDALETMVGELRVTDPTAAARIVELVSAASRGLMNADESRRETARILGLNIDAYKQKLREDERRNEELFAYILKLRQKYKTALLTNILKGGLEVRFAQGELARYFDVVVASCDIGYEKPQRQAYDITAQRLGIRPEECVFIDDRTQYCEGAEQAGMHALLYRSFREMKVGLASNYLLAKAADLL
jgi:epoxide hydrolase-like predicted phosphatase